MKTYQLQLLKSGSFSGFCDESKYNIGRFRAIAIVTMHSSFYAHYSATIRRILEESEVFEMKWYELTNAKMRFAVIKAFDYTIECADSGKLRIDVLIWDTYDTRHNVLRRDDLQNLQRMYYHLLNNVINKKWGDLGLWVVFPDISAVNWEELERVLQNQIMKTEEERKFTDPYGVEGIGLIKISPVISHECEAVQIADLFAGIGVHSREANTKHVSFFLAKRGRKCMYLSKQSIHTIDEIVSSLSRSDYERCLTLEHFYSLCKLKKWGIHLLRTNGLKTTDPTCPINFWHYTPQSPKDKAPEKEKR